MIFLLVLICPLLYSQSHISLPCICSITFSCFFFSFHFSLEYVLVACTNRWLHRNACLAVHVTYVFALLVASPVLHAPFSNLFMCISHLCTSSQSFWNSSFNNGHLQKIFSKIMELGWYLTQKMTCWRATDENIRSLFACFFRPKTFSGLSNVPYISNKVCWIWAFIKTSDGSI